MIINSLNIYEWLEKNLSEEKYLHSLGAAETAKELAEKFGEDIEKASLAALLHDNAKCYKYEEMLSIIKENNFPVDLDIQNNGKVLHAYLGAYLAEKNFNIDKRLQNYNKDVFNAIMFHTTGRCNMTMLEKIVYLADKIEPRTRPNEYRNNIIKILNETNNPDKAILVTLESTINSLVQRKLPINIQTINLWNQLISM